MWKPVQQPETLSPRMRNLISRATALVVGFLLLRGSLYFVRGITETEREVAEWRAQQPTGGGGPSGGGPTGGGEGRLVFFASLLGLPGFALIFFSLAPTKALYALPFVGPPSDPREDAESVARAMRRWSR